jgi:hypothetical protein
MVQWQKVTSWGVPAQVSIPRCCIIYGKIIKSARYACP